MFHRFLKHDLKRRAWKLAAPPADEFQRQPRVDLGPLFLYMGFEYPIGAVGHFKEHEEKREKQFHNDLLLQYQAVQEGNLDAAWRALGIGCGIFERLRSFCRAALF